MSTNNYSFINCASLLDVETAYGIDQAEDSCVQNVVSSIWTYHMEYDPYNRLGRLPQCFVRDFGDLIATHVILQDPNLNEIEVRAVKKCNDMYFEQGWSILKDFYDIWFGAWISFTYVNPQLFVIGLATRWGTDVSYPLHDPPYRLMLPITGVCPKIGTSVSFGTPSSRNVLPNLFVRSYLKRLTSYDVESGILILPWYGFGEFAFAFTFRDLVLVDHVGSRFPCSLQFSVDADGELACKVFGCWLEFCQKHKLAQGDRIRFAVNQPIQNYIMYVCVYPQIGIETTLNYPLSDGSYLPLYVSQQYFVASS